MTNPTNDTSDEYIDSLELPGLNLEVYAEPQLQAKAKTLMRFAESLWSQFVRIAEDERIFENLAIALSRQVLEVDLHWVGNTAMQALNREYRNKDSATDVLTFTLFADQPDSSPWKALPVIQLGSIFIGIEWAEEELRKDPALNLERYLLERWVHGLLHLLGQHHDTMEQFHRVVRIQQSVLDSVFIQADSCVSSPTTEKAL